MHRIIIARISTGSVYRLVILGSTIGSLPLFAVLGVFAYFWLRESALERHTGHRTGDRLMDKCKLCILLDKADCTYTHFHMPWLDWKRECSITVVPSSGTG